MERMRFLVFVRRMSFYTCMNFQTTAHKSKILHCNHDEDHARGEERKKSQKRFKLKFICKQFCFLTLQWVELQGLDTKKIKII